MRPAFLSTTLALCLSAFAIDAAAQAPPMQGQWGGQWSTQQGGQTWGVPPPPPPGAPTKTRSTALEVGYLYVTAAAWGVGTGIWIDAEAGIEDPGLQFIFPG